MSIAQGNTHQISLLVLETKAMISVELVPRSAASLEEELQLLKSKFSAVDMVNIPDLLRFPLRSWEACSLALASMKRALPHIRAMDFPIHGARNLAKQLQDRGISEALIVRGDLPQNFARPVHATSSVELIRALKEVAPELKLYAAIDPYRAGIRSEVEAAKAKVEAGAEGFFTQPFFDIRMMEMYRDLLPKVEIFWGLSPVVTEGSKRYWEVKNLAVFPSAFKPELSWNRDFAAEVIEWAKRHGESLYFMPIRVAIDEYLSGLL